MLIIKNSICGIKKVSKNSINKKNNFTDQIYNAYLLISN